ncbi:MAG: FprA family A-type flavoprotein, partial [Coprococcus sp.]|nr:FprA family A-type flavoprotein [Coprococcus sp.]
VMDTVDGKFGEEWLEKVGQALDGASPDYLIVQHMEPDHSANIKLFAEKYPEAVIVGNAKTFTMMENFFRGLDLGDRKLVVKNNETLSLGKHILTFVFAPMVHWPEVMVTYDSKDKVLFSADAFGKFGALDVDEDWACEARRYYFGIVGKYGVQAQALLKKAAGLDIQTICALHGPILKENLGYYLDLYNTWSSYGVESEGVVIAYTSVYGNTKKAVELLADKLTALGCPKVTVTDLARDDMAEAVEDAFRYGKLVLATTTYNGDIFPFMKTFIEHLTERGYKNRTIGLIENGSWAPTAAKTMLKMFEGSKNLTFTDTTVTIKSAVNAENEAQIAALAEELCK